MRSKNRKQIINENRFYYNDTLWSTSGKELTEPCPKRTPDRLFSLKQTVSPKLIECRPSRTSIRQYRNGPDHMSYTKGGVILCLM